MATGAPGVVGPLAPRLVDLAQKEGQEDVTTQLPQMGEEYVQDPVCPGCTNVTLKLAQVLNMHRTKLDLHIILN